MSAVVHAWHTSPMPDKAIAELDASLTRYINLAGEHTKNRHDVGDSLRSIAAKVAAGDTSFGDGLAEWATRNMAAQPGPAGRIDEVFYAECRRHARRACEAAARAIDWRAVIANNKATDELRYAIEAAGLV